MRPLDYTYYYKKWHLPDEEYAKRMTDFYVSLLREDLVGDSNQCLLDVGCGMGFAMLAAKKIGYGSVEGIDIDPGQVDAAKKLGLVAHLEPDSVAFLKSAKSKYTAVLCMDVIEHIPREHQLDFVCAIHDSLASNGTFICTVPNANSSLAPRWRYNDWTHHSSFTEHSLDFLLHSGGFSEISIREMEFLKRPKQVFLPVSGARHWWAFRFFRFIRRLQMMAELGPAVGRQVPLSLNILAVAKK